MIRQQASLAHIHFCARVRKGIQLWMWSKFRRYSPRCCKSLGVCKQADRQTMSTSPAKRGLTRSLNRPCRAAFSFVYGPTKQPGRGGPLGVLAGLLGGSRTQTAAELPATDMRALDSLENTLRKAGVLNK